MVITNTDALNILGHLWQTRFFWFFVQDWNCRVKDNLYCALVNSDLPNLSWFPLGCGALWSQCLWIWWKRASELLLQTVLSFLLGGSGPSSFERLFREPFALPHRRLGGVYCLATCSDSCGREWEWREDISYTAMVKEKSKPNAMVSLLLSFPVKKILTLEYVIEKFQSY